MMCGEGEEREEAGRRVEAGGESSLDQSQGTRSCDLGSDCRYILKVDMMVFADGLDVVGEKDDLELLVGGSRRMKSLYAVSWCKNLVSICVARAEFGGANTGMPVILYICRWEVGPGISESAL